MKESPSKFMGYALPVLKSQIGKKSGSITADGFGSFHNSPPRRIDVMSISSNAKDASTNLVGVRAKVACMPSAYPLAPVEFAVKVVDPKARQHA